MSLLASRGPRQVPYVAIAGRGQEVVGKSQGGQAVVAGDKVTSRMAAVSDSGGWSKMSDEPLAREREPIERVRARLEALVMAIAMSNFIQTRLGHGPSLNQLVSASWRW
jgi:hypothetical protein